MEIRDRRLLNETVAAGEEVVVRVDLANYHPARGRITLNLTANGSLVAQRTVTVGVDSERTVYLRAVPRVPGRYEMRLNDVSVGTVSVTGAESPTATDGETGTSFATATPTGTPEPASTTADGGTGTGTETGTEAPGWMGTVTPGIGPGDPTGTDAIVAMGMSLLLLYGVGVAVYVLREHPPSGLG